MSKRTTTILLLGCLIISVNLHADCRGCCSGHKGVVCVDGVTRCGDGKALSPKCQKKGCDKCEGAPQVEKDEDVSTKYDRDDWGDWIDADGDCQDTRAEILIRDNIGKIKFKRNKPCNVSWGKWRCPYTGKIITKASDMDIDHIVPLAHAYKTGGDDWPRKKKQQFVNDFTNLLAVEDNTNQSKGGKGPDEWKPPLKSYWKEYATKWKAVKAKYGLVVSSKEEKALVIMIH